MINKILQGIINFIITIVNWILSPLELALNAVIPNFSDALTAINNFINGIKSYIPFVLSYTGLTPATLTIIKGLLIGLVMVPLTAHGIKLAIKWYNALKP